MDTQILIGSYHLPLVALSIVIAILAAYTSLELAAQVTASQGGGRRLWLVGGAVVMGIGIWAMHFIGMLAFSLPLVVTYDAGMTLLSLLVAIAASALALA